MGEKHSTNIGRSERYPDDPPVTELPSAGTVVVFDLEFTAWEGSLARDWNLSWERREIIQIGAVELDAGQEFRETNHLTFLVRPASGQPLSAYISDLTGITDDLLKQKGQDFPKALKAFAEFAGEEGPIFSNGGDGGVLLENCELNDMELPIATARLGNVAHLLARHFGVNGNGVVSADLTKHLGVGVVGPRHDALADARAVGLALRTLRAHGWA